MYSARVIFSFLFAASIFTCCKQADTTGNGEDAVPSPDAVQTPVEITHPVVGAMADSVELNATSVYLQKNFIKANANGYLQSNFSRPGQFVQKGQVLFIIKTKEAQSIGDAVNGLDSSFRFSGTNAIRSGQAGFIAQLSHQAGDYVQDGEQLAVVNDAQSFVFVMDLPYQYHQLLATNKQLKVVLPDGTALPGTIAGSLQTVDPAAQTQSVTIHVTSKEPIPENLIGKVKLCTTSKPSAITLPRAAVLSDETQENFWIMELSDSVTAIKVPVKKGLETKDKVEILSPVLKAQDRIVLTGNYGLADTAKVKIIDAATKDATN